MVQEWLCNQKWVTDVTFFALFPWSYDEKVLTLQRIQTEMFYYAMAKKNSLQQVYEQWQQMQPLPEDSQRRLSVRFSLDFNYNSNHIEGNTLTYGQTELLLLFGRVVQSVEMKDLEEMKASDVGLKMMQEEANVKDYPLTETFIRQLHKTLLREDYQVYRDLPGGAKTSFTIHAGQYKTRPNSVITRYGDRFDYASPEETPALMADLVRWYNEQERKGEMHPVDLAILFHYRYIRIHPFEDGNGRIARLLVNYILSRHDYPMIAVRSRNKKYYLEALHRADLKVGQNPSEGASATLNQIKPFRDYFTQLIADEIAGYITFLTHRGDNIWWYDGAVVTFNSQTPATVLREMKYNPMIQPGELAEIAGVSRVAIVKTIKQLTEKGYIIQDENSKVERWHVIITDLSR